MKKVLITLLILVLVGLTGWLGYYFYKKSNKPPIVYKTELPFVTSITKKTVAVGSIVPKREVQIKPQVSGIVDELYVEAGETVKKGQLIAKIRIVPNVVNVNNAETTLQTARINLQQAQKEFDRNKALYEQKAISELDYNRIVLDYDLKKEALESAETNLQLVKEGASKKAGQVSNLIYSTVDGMILDVPVKVGTSVIERNNFNEGTTIASVADMKSLIFEGKIDESEVGKIKEGMDLNLTIGAIEGKVFKAKLEHISPKGVTEEGAIKFQIKAQVILSESDFIRAGYSANADIVLDQKDSVLAIKESLLQFEKNAPFVEVEKSPNVFEKRKIKTGISDGINIEILDGVKKGEKIKSPAS